MIGVFLPRTMISRPSSFMMVDYASLNPSCRCGCEQSVRSTAYLIRHALEEEKLSVWQVTAEKKRRTDHPHHHPTLVQTEYPLPTTMTPTPFHF